MSRDLLTIMPIWEYRYKLRIFFRLMTGVSCRRGATGRNGEDGHEKRGDDRGGEYSHHQGGPDQGLRPVVVEEEHHHRLHRRQRLRSQPGGEGGVECLPHEVSL